MSLTSAVKKENNIYELEVAVSAEDLKAATDNVFKRKVKDINVPGFRKGKAPRKIIEKMYGEGIFMEDAVNDIYPTAYSAAVEEAGIDPVDRANVEMLTMDMETGFTFKATVTVKPEVSVKDYKGIKAEKKIYKVTDEDIDAEIARMRDRNARIITIEDRPAKMDDMTVIDFEGSIDGVPFEGGKGDGYQLTLGSHSFIDGFEEQIVGHNTGDEFDVNVSFPEEYHAEELKGKPAVFKVKLVEIKGKELPELDDEFVKDVSEFDTLAELRADIEKKQQEIKEKQTNDEFENQLVDKVIEGFEGDVPDVMYENRIDEIVRDFEYRLSSQGMNIDLYLQYTGMDMESFRKTFRDQAEHQVKIRLALEKIVELEGIEPTEDEIAKEYEKVAEMYNMEAEKVKAFVTEKDVKADIASNKAIDLIRDSAVVTEVEAGQDEKNA
ncbi:MAG: trigger factor [Oscillospiraceae bacterium]|jgi:trigger factor|nr:trigger factor [Oscillospiraceae bacterium]